MGRFFILLFCTGGCLLSTTGVASAQRAYIDPQTGKLASPPPPAQAPAPKTSAQRKVIAAPARAYRRADGALVLHLGPESRVQERVTLDESGQLRRAGHE